MLGVDFRLELSVLVTSFNGQKSSINLCFLEPSYTRAEVATGICISLDLIKQTGIPTPEYIVFSEEMSL